MRAGRRSATVWRAAAGVGAGLTLAGCAVPLPDGARDLLGTGAGEVAADTSAATRREVAPDADGTFSGSGTYETPGGPQRIDVTVELADGEVTDVRVDPEATNATSRRFQERFASAVVDTVVGRRLDEVVVDRVAGSSSTGEGFMRALDEVARHAADGTTVAPSERDEDAR